MSIIELRDALFWCWVINIGIMLWWWLWLVTAHDLVFRLHSRWIGVTIAEESFSTMHYCGLIFYKILNLVFFLIPWIALHIVA